MKRVWVVLLALALVGAGVGAIQWRRTRSPAWQLAQRRGEVEIHLRRGDREKAAAALEKVLALAPKDVGASIQLADLLASLGRPTEAEAVIRRAIERAPKELSLQVALAALLLQGERAAEVVVLLLPQLEAIQAHPEPLHRTDALVLLGEALAGVGQVERGLTLLREAIDLRETHGLHRPGELVTGDALVQDYLALGRVLSAAGRWKDAEGPLLEARKLAPDGRAVNLALAEVLDRLGRPTESVELLRTLYEAQQASRLDLGPQLGEFLVRSEQLDAAKKLADALAGTAGGPGGGTERGLGAAAYVRGLIALAEGKLGDARGQFQEMAKHLPRSVQARLLLAQVEKLSADPAAARTHLEAALAIEPGLPEAELGLLELDERKGDTARVRERALRLLASARARPQAVRTLLGLYAQDRDPKPAQARLRDLRAASPEDLSLRLFGALFDLLGAEQEQGAKELAAIAGHPGVDLEQAFGLLARAREGGAADAQEAIDLLAWIASQEPRLAPARVVLASIYERLGRADLALRELDRALEVETGLVPARRARARILSAQGELARAAADLEQLRAASPEDGALLTELAELHVRRGDAPGALPLLEQAVSLAPQDARSHARLGRVQVLAGNLRAALKSFGSARTFDPRLPSSHQEAAVHLLQEDATAAAEAWRRARAETGEVGMSIPLAVALALQGQPAAALIELDQARGGATGELLRALLLQLAGDARRGTELLGRLGAPPEVVRGLEQTDATRARPALEACALAAVGWAPELRQRTARLLEAAQPNAFLVFLAAALPGNEGDPDLALRLSRRLAELVSGSSGPGLLLAEAQRSAGDQAAELATLEGLFARFPEHPEVSLRLGMALERRGQKERAILLYSRAAAVPNPSPLALNNLAYLLADDPARRPVAIEHARRATRLAPSNGRIQDTLGWLLFLDGQWVDAERALTEAVALDPASPTLRYHLARVLEARGARARAQNHLRVALLGGQGFADLADAQARLDRLTEELRPAATPPLELVAGPALDVATGEQGLARLRLPGGGEARVVGLRFTAPSGCAATALFAAPGGEVLKRLEAAPGEALLLPRFALDPTGCEVVVRIDASHSGASVRFELLAPAAGGETEPDEDPARAAVLGAGGTARGRLDGPADRDHLRLDPGPGKAAALRVKAGPRGPLRVELLRAGVGEGRTVRLFKVEPGSELALDPLRSGSDLLVRISAAAALASGAAEGGASDWELALAAAEEASGADKEPNDRPEDAARLEAGTHAGRLGSGDPVDWLRVSAPAGSLVSIALEAADDGLDLRIWDEEGAGLLPLRSARLEGGDAVRLPRWRVPASGELVLGLAHAPVGAVARPCAWKLVVGPAEAQGETEPNDQAGAAESLALGTPASGALDAPGDRDWVRVTPPQGGLLELSFSAPDAAPALEGAAVGVYAATPSGPALLARFLVRGRALHVPAVRIPGGFPALVLLLGPGDRALGAWELTAGAAPESPDLEEEPDDEVSRARDLPATGAPLRGEISGALDRDLVRCEGAKALVVECAGPLPLAAALLGRPAKVVLPGSSERFELEGRGPAVLELALPPEAAPREAGGTSWKVSAER